METVSDLPFDLHVEVATIRATQCQCERPKRACLADNWAQPNPPAIKQITERTCNPAWQIIGPSDIPVSEGWAVPKAMDNNDIGEIISAFANAAKRAVKAGFKVIEIHSAHGYLLHSFLSPLANKRNDART